MVKVLLALVLGLLVAWYFVRRRGGNNEETRADRRVSGPDNDSSTYHAVSLKFDANACSAAKSIAGRRFLASEAPRVPLPDCDAADCRCRFVHHKDRRSGKDRRSPFTSGGLAAASGKYERERRQGNDRRTDEDDIDFEI